MRRALNRCQLGLLLGLLCGVVFGQSASAVPVVPTYTTFGELAAADFGGSGINDDHVAISTITSGSDTITLGVTIFNRFENPAPTNNGAGTFTVLPGANFGDPTFVTMPSANLGATWSLGYYMSIAGGGTFADYSFEVLYDFDPAAGTDEADHGLIDINAGIVALAGPVLPFVTEIDQNENVLFAHLQPPQVVPYIIPPALGFDPDAEGNYTLALLVRDGVGTEIGRAALELIVDDGITSSAALVPEPSSFCLASLGFCLLLRRGRRRNSTGIIHGE